MFYIGTKEACDNYVEWINNIENYNSPSTLTWSIPFPSFNQPSVYAVLVSPIPDYPNRHELEFVMELPSHFAEPDEE